MHVVESAKCINFFNDSGTKTLILQSEKEKQTSPYNPRDLRLHFFNYSNHYNFSPFYSLLVIVVQVEQK